MAAYRFDKFTFDTNSYELRVDDVLMAMRPKTAVLMAALIEQRTQLLGKQDLISQVWHSEHVQHQSLFQAISEIRKLLSPLQPIKTHPNLGYQWVAPVKELRKRSGMKYLAAALLPLASVSAMLVWHFHPTTPVNSVPIHPIKAQAMLQSPAMQAFSNGIEHLNNQQLTEARDDFELAERENPLFLEASLMKAEIIFQQADYAAAESITDDLLLRAIARDDTYIEVSAQGLLSRISEKSGQWNHALDWALKADSNARDQGFACVAENTRTRVTGLLGDSDLPVNKVGTNEQPALIESSEQDSHELANDYPDSSHCESLRQPSEAQPSKPDLSQCLDLSGDYQTLANTNPVVSGGFRWG